MRNTIGPSSLCLKDRRQIRLERIRVRVKPIMILRKAAARRVHHSACVAVFAAKAVAVATLAMAKAASNISKATEAARKAPEQQWKNWLLGLGLQNKPCREFRRLGIKTEAVRKRQSAVTLASAARGPALPSKEDTDKDTSQPPLHLMVPMDLCEGSGGNSYYPYSALINSGATYNFISLSVVDKLRLEEVQV
jgi:hypothetical protein